jgi:cytochrome c oxidase subunit 1
MRGGWVVFHTPILCTIGCVVTLTMTGLISILMAKPPVNRTLHDTYYIVSHLHYLLSLAAVFGFFAAWYYLFPKITGYAYSNLLGRIHFWLLFIGVNVILVPQILFFARMVERLADAPGAFRYWNLGSWIGKYIAAVSTLVFILNMVLSLLRRRPAH